MKTPPFDPSVKWMSRKVAYKQKGDILVLGNAPNDTINTHKKAGEINHFSTFYIRFIYFPIWTLLSSLAFHIPVTLHSTLCVCVHT